MGYVIEYVGIIQQYDSWVCMKVGPPHTAISWIRGYVIYSQARMMQQMSLLEDQKSVWRDLKGMSIVWDAHMFCPNMYVHKSS